MQVDWLTVSAQWVNFLILMWLLRRFLYRPVIRAMDRRQQTIDARIEEAGQKSLQAEQEAEQYRNKLSELEVHRSHLIAAARKAADSEREKLVEHARDEIKVMAAQWRREVEHEKTIFKPGFAASLAYWSPPPRVRPCRTWPASNWSRPCSPTSSLGCTVCPNRRSA